MATSPRITKSSLLTPNQMGLEPTIVKVHKFQSNQCSRKFHRDRTKTKPQKALRSGKKGMETVVRANKKAHETKLWKY